MLRYLVRRTLFMILVLWIVSVLTFVIFFKLPVRDPAQQIAGKGATAEVIANVRHQLGLDQPLLEQYRRFAKGLIPLPGFWLNEQVYYNWTNRVAVWEEMRRDFPYTAVLTFGAAVLWLAIGIPLGIISAIRRGSVWDRAGMVFALIGVSAPTFWLGFLFLWVFHYGLRMFPGSGIPPQESLWGSVLQGRFFLPWLTLAITSAAFYTRMVRGNLLETMSEDYIRTARAKGLSERAVTYRHGLRAALTPVVTMFGLDVGILLGGAVITETVFNIPGIGSYAIRSIFQFNFPGTMGVTVFAAFFIVVANLVVDVLYAYLDPRVRYE
jgi:peptide/nickel transport system permease protein